MSSPAEPPAETDARPSFLNRFIRGRELFHRGGRFIGWILLALVVYVLLRGTTNPYDSVAFDAGLLTAVALVAAGVLLLRGHEPASAREDIVERTAPTPRPRSPLGVLTLSVLFLVVGVMILLGNLDLAEVTIGQVAAACLTVIGLGLLVGAWWGRSRLLIVVGLVLVPLVIAGGFMHFPLRGSIGDQWVHTRSIEDVKSRYELLVGALYLDLPLRDFSGTRTIDISMAAGNATIYLPQRIALTINGHIEFGNANIGRGRQTGDDLALSNELAGRPGAGRLTINFRGGITSLYVERISFAERFGRPRKRESRDDKRGSVRRGDRAERSDARGDGDRRRHRAQT